jgi:ABC-type nitrate/sulfonate/bicarbonate transport system substrate-binding protein
VSPFSGAASSPTRVTIHVPSKSLSIIPYYFGKDKGFFAPELVEPQLVMMSPPTAIAALVAGELDFSSTTGAATSAIMRGLPLRRYFYVQAEPAHVLLAQPEPGFYVPQLNCPNVIITGKESVTFWNFWLLLG